MAERDLADSGMLDTPAPPEPMDDMPAPDPPPMSSEPPPAEVGHVVDKPVEGAKPKKGDGGDSDDEVSMAAALLQDLSSMAAAQREMQKPAEKSELDESTEHEGEGEGEDSMVKGDGQGNLSTLSNLSENMDGDESKLRDSMESREGDEDDDEEDDEDDEDDEDEDDPMAVFIDILPDHNRTLLKNLNEQRERGEFCDVTIQVGGRNFAAHKCLLAAACPKLHAMVANMRPELMNVLHLKELNPLGFEVVLEYLYTGHLECQTKHVHDVLAVAQYLELHDIAKHYYTQQASRTLMDTLQAQEAVGKEKQPSGFAGDFLDKLKNLISETNPGVLNSTGKVNIKTEHFEDEDEEDEHEATIAEMEAEFNLENPSGQPGALPPEKPKQTTQDKLVKDYMRFLEAMQEEMQRTFAGQTPVETVAYTTTRSGRRTRKPLMPQRNELADGSLGWRRRGRGRGRRSYDLDDGETPRRKRGRPRKNPIEDEELLNDDEGDDDEGEVVDDEVPEGEEATPRRKGRKKGPRPFCDKCDRTFKSRINLEKHMKLHETHKSLECPMCQKKFLRRVELTRHMHTEHSTTTFTCTICNTSFTDPFVYKKHMIDQHKVMRPFPCQFPGCQFSTGRLSTLNRHFPIHTGERNFICKKCGKGFAQSGGLRMHIQGCYQKRSYLCDICGAKFNQLQSMKEHRVLHTGEKPFACADCGSRFSDRTNFKRHRRIHDNVYPYGCTVCGKRFRHSNSFKVHCEKEGHLSEMPKNHPNCGITYAPGQRSPRQKKGFYSRQLFNQQQGDKQNMQGVPDGASQGGDAQANVQVVVSTAVEMPTAGNDNNFLGGKRMQYDSNTTQDSFQATAEDASRMSLPEGAATNGAGQAAGVQLAGGLQEQRNFSSAYSFLKDIQHGNLLFNKDATMYRDGIPAFPNTTRPEAVPLSAANMFSPFTGSRENTPQNFSTTGRDSMLLNLSPAATNRDNGQPVQPPPARHTQPHSSSYDKDSMAEADVLRNPVVSMPDRMVATSYHDTRAPTNHPVSMTQETMPAAQELRASEATTVGPQPHAAVHGYPFTYGTYPPPTPQQMQSYAHLSNLTQAAVNQIYGYPGKI